MLFYILSLSILLSIIPLFILLNISNSYLVKELNIYNVNNKEFDTIKHAIATLTKPLGSIPKE